MGDPAMAVIVLRLIPISLGDSEDGPGVPRNPRTVVDRNPVMLVVREDASLDDGTIGRRHARDIRPGDVIHRLGEPYRVIWVAEQPAPPLPGDRDEEESA